MRGHMKMMGAMALGLAVAPACGQNLLGNGSFETMGPGFDEFSVWGVFNNAFADGPADISNEVTAQDGVRSLKCFGFFSGAQNDHGVFQVVSVTAGTEYTLSGYGLTLSSDAIEPFDPADPDGNGFWGNLPLVIVDFKDGPTAAANVLASAEVNLYPTANPDVWNFGQTTAVAPAGATHAQVTVLFIQFTDSPGSFFFDNIALEAGGTQPQPCNAADIDGSGNLTIDDIDLFVQLFLQGCP